MRRRTEAVLGVAAVVLVLAGCDDSGGGGGGDAPPTITSHPSDQTVTEGHTGTFSVTATGSGTLAYQWYKGVVAIAGAELSFYTTPPSTLTDDGALFACTVSNTAGSITSNAATLTVSMAAPQITTHPVDQTITEGQTATFSVTATGSGTLTYQWKKSGVNVTGGTGGQTTSYMTPAAVLTDSGAQFTCVVTNTGGSIASNAATLTVSMAAPQITTHPVDQTITEGQTATFSVTATGSGTLTYQWKKNGVNVTGGTGGATASYTTPATVLADSAAQFTCVVTNAGGSVESNPATLMVNPTGGGEYKVIDLTSGAVTDTAGVPDLETNGVYKTTKLVLKHIPADSLHMGDQTGAGYASELPVHTVNITQPFYVGVFEVTQNQWTTIMGAWTFCFPGNPTYPAELVSWDDIKGSGGFMDTLSSLAVGSGMSFRLPTEAEWEYCCKAGTSTNYSYGNTEDGAWMWYTSNSGFRTHEVGTTPNKPNPWGLYDMHGNVWEWCQDWYDSGYYGVSPSNDPQGPASGIYRVLRGGSWYISSGPDCRSAFRRCLGPTGGASSIGFRVAAADTGP